MLNRLPRPVMVLSILRWPTMRWWRELRNGPLANVLGWTTCAIVGLAALTFPANQTVRLLGFALLPA